MSRVSAELVRLMERLRWLVVVALIVLASGVAVKIQLRATVNDAVARVERRLRVLVDRQCRRVAQRPDWSSAAPLCIVLLQVTTVNAHKPTDRQLIRALRTASRALGEPVAYVDAHGRFHFPLDSRWSVAISAESAGRFRVAVFRNGRERATLWALARDLGRLAGLVRAAKAEVAALAA